MKKLLLFFIIGILLIATVFAGMESNKDKDLNLDKKYKDTLAKRGIIKTTQSNITCDEKLCRATLTTGSSISLSLQTLNTNQSEELIQQELKDEADRILKGYAESFADLDKIGDK